MTNRNVYIYCEGPTEESFIHEIIAPYLRRFQIYAQPIICTSKRTATKKYKGGVSSYGKLKKELSMLCSVHKNEYLTTMFDFYGMPQDTPLIDHKNPDIYNRVNDIEKAINQDLGASNCCFNLVLHEFETLLFSDAEAFSIVFDDKRAKQIQKIRAQFPNPEYINNSVETAPSKRIISIIPDYKKIVNGTELSGLIGIDQIMKECPHFCQWIEKIIQHFNA